MVWKNSKQLWWPTSKPTLSLSEHAERKPYKTDQHGDALAGLLLHRWCGVNRDVDLPHVHMLILKAKSPKEKTYGILDNLFIEQTAAMSLGMAEGSEPKSMTGLVNEVFRSYKPANSGSEVGKGLSPFGIMMEGHDGFTQLNKAICQASTLESGTSVSLADADMLLANDSHFPSTIWMVVEKLNGWSVVVDVFHRVNHPIAVSIRTAVQQMGPRLQRLAATMSDDVQSGLELVCRIIYDMQQDYFLYMSHVGRGEAYDIPTFTKLIDMVSSNHATSLTNLPQACLVLQAQMSCSQEVSTGQCCNPGSSALAIPIPGAAWQRWCHGGERKCGHESHEVVHRSWSR
jgi:hypothetical protein